MSDELWARMPKTEVHLHLEGTIAPETLWSLARRNHVALPVGSLAELQALYVFESFDHFIELWLLMCSCLRKDADYEQMVDAFAAQCASDNVRYVEAHFTPYNHEKLGIGGRRALEIVSHRLLASERAGGPVVRLIADIPSESAPESGPFTVGLLEEEANPLIVAIGLGGPEYGFPGETSRVGSTGRERPATRRWLTRARPRAPSTCGRRWSTSRFGASNTVSARSRTSRSSGSSPSGRSAATWP